MRSAAWPQMVLATFIVMVLPAMIVGGLSTLGVINSVWAAVLVAVGLSLAFSSAGSAYWRRHASGDILFSDLLLWGWLRRRRTQRRLGRADDLLREAGEADSTRKSELLRELGGALDAQDPYLDGHSRRVARYVTMIALRMDLSDEQVERAKAAATIHDVGKLRIPEEIVYKPGRLTDEEFELMKQHAAAGGVMVECLGDPALAAAVRAHHERWDGSGYPDGLAGEQIPIEARVISVADTFDAITSARPYRAAKPHVKALDVIDEEAGRQLDPEAAAAFISCYSDRRGAALWAGLASIPRQVASRLSTSPAELSGAVAAAVTAPLVVLAGAVASEVMPSTSYDRAVDPPAAEQQAAVSPAATATPQPNRRSSTATPTVTPASGTPTAGATETALATATATAAPPAGAVAGASAESGPTTSASATPEPPASAVETTPTATPVLSAGAPGRAASASENPLLPEDLPPLFSTENPSPVPKPTATPIASPEATPTETASPEATPTETASPEPTPTETASPEPTSTPTASPEPTPPVEPEPTPDPLPPLIPDTLPVFPTPAPPSHTVDDCRNGGWEVLGYPNQGQCVADADKNRPDHPRG